MGYLSVLSFPTFFERHLSRNIQTKDTCCILIDIMTYLMIAANIISKPGSTAGASIPGRQMPVLGGIAAIVVSLCTKAPGKDVEELFEKAVNSED